MGATVELAEIVDGSQQKLDPKQIAVLVEDPQAGAVVTFTGMVRNNDQGEQVSGIDYSAHPSAEKILRKIAAGFTTRQGVCKIAVQHAVGRLKVGDLAVVIAVSAKHRGQAFTTCEGLIDQIKAELPVWKKQEFTDGRKIWSGIN